MKWTQITITAIVTLAATALAGVLVYYITEGRSRYPAAKLVYETLPPTAFNSNKAQVVIHSFKVRNDGAKEAENVTVGATLPSGSEIVDCKAQMSGGFTIPCSLEFLKPNVMKAELPLLNPHEWANFAILVQGTDDPTIDLSVRGTGIGGTPAAPEQAPVRQPTDVFVSAMMPMIAMLEIGLLGFYVMGRRMRPVDTRSVHSEELNNLAFRFLHKGLVDSAISLLQRSIDERPNAFNLSNMGQALSLNKEHERALTMCDLAEEYADSKHAKAVVLYNRACAQFLSGNKEEGMTSLKQALLLSPTDIQEYVASNRNLVEIRRDADVSGLLGRYAPRPTGSEA